MKLSTSGPAIDIGTVSFEDEDDIVAVAVAEALNLAVSHLQSRLAGGDQAALGVYSLLAANIAWASKASGMIPPQVCAHVLPMCHAMRHHVRVVAWQEPIITDP